MKNFKELRKELLANSDTMNAYKERKEEFDIAKALIKARIDSNMTQAEVADKMHTSQAQIARMESGHHTPSFLSIKRYARAVNQKIYLQVCP
jgi:predicted transcriptional regulator